jgi:hypothetical protein
MSVSEPKYHVHDYEDSWKCVHCGRVLAPELRGDRSLGNTDQFPEARP